MYLKTLEIQGFKSFADKTVFEFAQGVTGIVGPNGCGKSNVVDAIRWVLGETSAKALRGGEMADVIFNGTEKRKPLGMAEVTLTMADCEESLKVDFNEVSLTRRVFRDGRSEYRLNGTLCRLKDIHDLLMDTGIGRTAYSIMAQGQIDQILSSKPEERRAVFEEAAGITKFKREKKDALRKLEYTEANLLRVSDVLAEQERRMNSLKRQVAKARRFQSLSADYHILDTHLAHKRFTEITGQRAELTTSIRSLEAQDSHLSYQLPEKEEKVSEARSSARLFESELAEIRQQLNTHQNALTAAQSRIAFNNERKAELENRISQNHADIAATREKLAQQEFDFTAANEALEQLTRRIAEQELELEKQEERTLAARSNRANLEASLRSSRAEANKTQTLIATMQAKIESSLAQLEGNRERARQLAEEEQRLNLGVEEHIEQQTRIASLVSETSSQLTELEESFQQAERNYQRIRGDLDSSRKAATESNKILAQRSARHDAVKQLVASGEGFAKGTQNLLKGLDQPDHFKNSIEGVLASFIRADDSAARAIEAALGAKLQTVLVTDSSIAQELIERLTEKKLGLAAILPRDLVPKANGTQMETVPSGAIAWALDRVKSEPRVSSIIEQLLEKTLIVPDLKTALKLRGDYSTLTFVTLAGETLSPEGTIQGGAASGASASLLERQNEVRALENEVSELTAKDQQARSLVIALEADLEAGRESVEVARERLQKQKVELSTLQGQLSLASREVENFNTRIENVRWERNELEKRESAASDSRESLESELAASRERLEAIESQTRALQSQSDSAAEAEQELNAVLNELRTNLAVEKRAKQAAEEQQRPMEARLSELREIAIRRETEIENFTQRIQASIDENESLASQVEDHQLESEDLQQELSQKAEGRTLLIKAIEDAEIELTKIRKDLASINEQKGREEIAATKLDLRLENLVSSTEERHQIVLASFQPDAHSLLATLQSRAARNASGADETDSEILATHNSAINPSEEIKDMPGEPNWSHVESLVHDIKRKIESMGPVNIDAIEEYDELEERHNFLRNQHDDLVSSKTELLSVIERINEETQRRFKETFAQVRINFRDMFKELFGEKGQADLTLIDENDPLESGIEVIAKPPGKKLQSITLLSGGERSMTAVALLFSIYMIKPSPFCVLDELDAPLDESNINRFVKVLDRFIDRSQFIIVTHSKRTMARADVMYGVTMEEFGVSKPVGMRLTSSSSTDLKGEAKSAAQKAALRLDA
ncbi:chromosome segregation protein SMC [Luteolibacter algae]|uniref:Chromosome partition protein Smc n=1 Tax=Luteolibacter algae TaxID=454151 RepID=A0ABW5D809_9BACT